MSPRAKKVLITLGATAVAILHVARPALSIDGVTVALLIVAIAPWMADIVKSVTLPGGFSFELQEVERDLSEAKLLSPPADGRVKFPNNPRRALALLAANLDERVHEARGDRSPAGLQALADDQRRAIARLQDVIERAAESPALDSSAAEWVQRVGPRLLSALDEGSSKSGTP